MRYSIFDPTGNITALVESNIEVASQSQVAAEIMTRHPQIEQVGFVSYSPNDRVCLRMAGGEFCGNATMSAAALHLLRNHPDWESATVRVEVSGAEMPVEVRLTKTGATTYSAGVRMPKPLSVEHRVLSYDDIAEPVPVVFMQGISHVVINDDSRFGFLLVDMSKAEAAVAAWCAKLGADGLGIMFLEHKPNSHTLTPLVYVPGSNTVFWENSCASGTSAVGMYLASVSHSPIDVTFSEPGGYLRVQSDPITQETWLYGNVKLA